MQNINNNMSCQGNSATQYIVVAFPPTLREKQSIHLELGKEGQTEALAINDCYIHFIRTPNA
jgi:hypothetical protein